MELSKDAKSVMSAFTQLSFQEKDILIDYMFKMVEEESMLEKNLDFEPDFSTLIDDDLLDPTDDIYSKTLTLAGLISEESLQNDNAIYKKTEKSLREFLDYLDSL